MIKVTEIILNSIFIFFPVSLYINYLEYIETNAKEEKNIILNILFILSLYLIVLYNENKNEYLLIFYNILLISSILRKEKRLFLLLFIITIINISKYKISTELFIIKMLLEMTIIIIKRIPVKIKIISFSIIELLYFFIITKKPITLNLIITCCIIVFIEIITIIIINNIINRKQKNIAINEVVKELEKEKLLRSSISKLTHELKNPIAVCKGYLGMIDLNDNSKTEKYLSIITEEIERSKTIMDEFSAYGKLKKLESEEMDLSLLLEDISHVLTPIFKEDNAILDIPKIKELYIKGDYNKLKQVFINLLKNTLEAKKENRQLVVTIKLKEYKENILISINDNGIGMSENTLSKIYEVFYTTKPQGTGLGLTFSKEVIELHQGTINIKSEKDKGTNIIIRLPK